MSILAVDTIQGQTTAGNVKLPAGCILQTESTTVQGEFSNASSSLVDITGMTLTITPKYATSKILITAQLNWGGVINIYAGIRLIRGSTFISNATSATGAQTFASIGCGGDNENFHYKLEHTAIQFLDSPATTNATTYKLQQQSVGGPGTNTWHLNRPAQSDNAAYIVRGTSTFTVQEIAQ